MSETENNYLEGIPKTLLKDYDFSKQAIKYGPFGDENYEKDKIQPLNPNIMLEKVNLLHKSLSNILEHISFFIRINKNGFNELCIINNKKSLDYHILFKLVINLIEQILDKIDINRINKTEALNFEKILNIIENEYPKYYNLQYSTSIEIKPKADKIINFIQIVKNHNKEPGMIVTHVSEYASSTYIKNLEYQIRKFN